MDALDSIFKTDQTVTPAPLSLKYLYFGFISIHPFSFIPPSYLGAFLLTKNLVKSSHLRRLAVITRN